MDQRQPHGKMLSGEYDDILSLTLRLLAPTRDAVNTVYKPHEESPHHRAIRADNSSFEFQCLTENFNVWHMVRMTSNDFYACFSVNR